MKLLYYVSPIHLNYIDVPGGSNNQQVRSYSFASINKLEHPEIIEYFIPNRRK